MSTEDNRKTGPKEYIGHMDVIRGKTMNEVIFWESQLADGHYNLYVKLQPCPECEKLKANGLVFVTKEDAESYCRILTLLGMEEEGSPIEEVERLLHLREGMVCADCQDTGWLENRIEGKYPCTCMTEAEPYQLLEAECEKLKAERDELAAQVTHWKANHASVAEQARILKERPDMPIERVKAYENWVAMAVQVEKIREALKEMVGDFTVRSQLGAEIYKRAVSALALPDLYTGILNRVRAETLRKAADIFESEAIGSANMSTIRALAADMEAGKC